MFGFMFAHAMRFSVLLGLGCSSLVLASDQDFQDPRQVPTATHVGGQAAKERKEDPDLDRQLADLFEPAAKRRKLNDKNDNDGNGDGGVGQPAPATSTVLQAAAHAASAATVKDEIGLRDLFATLPLELQDYLTSYLRVRHDVRLTMVSKGMQAWRKKRNQRHYQNLLRPHPLRNVEELKHFLQWKLPKALTSKEMLWRISRQPKHIIRAQGLISHQEQWLLPHLVIMLGCPEALEADCLDTLKSPHLYRGIVDKAVVDLGIRYLRQPGAGDVSSKTDFIHAVMARPWFFQLDPANQKQAFIEAVLNYLRPLVAAHDPRAARCLTTFLTHHGPEAPFYQKEMDDLLAVVRGAQDPALYANVAKGIYDELDSKTPKDEEDDELIAQEIHDTPHTRDLAALLRQLIEEGAASGQAWTLQFMFDWKPRVLLEVRFGALSSWSQHWSDICFDRAKDDPSLFREILEYCASREDVCVFNRLPGLLNHLLQSSSNEVCFDQYNYYYWIHGSGNLNLLSQTIPMMQNALISDQEGGVNTAIRYMYNQQAFFSEDENAAVKQQKNEIRSFMENLLKQTFPNGPAAYPETFVPNLPHELFLLKEGLKRQEGWFSYRALFYLLDGCRKKGFQWDHELLKETKRLLLGVLRTTTSPCIQHSSRWFDANRGVLCFPYRWAVEFGCEEALEINLVNDLPRIIEAGVTKESEAHLTDLDKVVLEELQHILWDHQPIQNHTELMRRYGVPFPKPYHY